MRPHVIINMAMSVDGKVSSSAQEPVAFTSREDRRLLLKIRSRCDAMIVGSHTVALGYQDMGISNPLLRAARLRRGQTEYPLRVIVSGRLNLSRTLGLFKAPISPILIACCESAPRSRRHEFSRLGHLIVCGRSEVDIPRLFSLLATNYRVRIILCEGGPTLNDALFRSGWVNELYLTLSPRIVGGRNAPTLVEGMGCNRLQDAARGRLVACRKDETEWFLRYKFGRHSISG